MLTFIALWELAAIYFASVNPRADQIFPRWEQVFTTSTMELGTFDRTGTDSYAAAWRVISEHSWETLRRVVVGTTVGMVTGAICGLAMAYSRTALKVMSGPIQVVRSVPLLALIPLFILWFGGRELGMYLFIGFAAFVMVVIGAYHAALNSPVAPQRFARALGASRVQMFRDVVVPAMLPELFATVRIVLALSWSFALGAEFTGAQSGLGYLLILSERFGNVGRVVVITMIFTLFALLADQLLKAARKRLLKWA